MVGSSDRQCLLVDFFAICFLFCIELKRDQCIISDFMFGISYVGPASVLGLRVRRPGSVGEMAATDHWRDIEENGADPKW